MTPAERRRLLADRQAAARDDAAGLGDAAWEAARVRFAVKTLGAGGLAAALERERRRAGLAGPTFDLLAALAPDLPWRLGASRLRGARLHADPRCVWPALIRAFPKAPFVVAYLEFAEQVADRGVTPALVFPRKGVPQGLVIHPAAALPLDADAGTVLVGRAGGADLAVRSFAAVVRWWAADGLTLTG